jgi:hypothetical protein
VPHRRRVVVEDVGGREALLLAVGTDDPRTQALHDRAGRGQQQRVERGRLDHRRGSECVGADVFVQTALQLPRGRVFPGQAGQVDRADEQPAGADAGLDDVAELVVAGEVVDHLHERPEVARQVVEDQAAAPLDELVPLPVAMELGGEVGEERVLRVAQDAHRVRFLGGEPHRAPEDGQEPARQRPLRADLLREEHDRLARGEGGLRGVVPCAAHDRAGRSGRGA